METNRLPFTRVDDAFTRQQRAKERFLGAAMVSRPAKRKALRQVIGRDEHRAIADEMARFL